MDHDFGNLLSHDKTAGKFKPGTIANFEVIVIKKLKKKKKLPRKSKGQRLLSYVRLVL